MKQFIRKYSVELMLITIMVISLFSNISVIFDRYAYTSYLMNYDSGFGVRKLIGSIADLIIPSFVPYRVGVYVFVGMATMLLIVFAAILVGKFLRSLKDSTIYNHSLYLILFYFLSPASIALFFPHHNFGRMDMFILLFTLLGVVILNSKGKLYRWRYPLLTIICVICCLIHQMFIFTYFTIIAALLIYDCLQDDFKKKSLIGTGVVFAVTAIFSLYIQFTPSTDMSYDQIMELVAHKVPADALHVYEKPVHFEYFASIKMHLEEYVMPNLGANIFKNIVTIILLLPLLIFFRYVWKNIIALAPKKYKITYNIMQLLTLAVLPLFILTVDYGRWYAAYFIFQFVILFVLMYKRDPYVVQASEIIGRYFKEHIILFAMLLLYSASLGLFRAAFILDISEQASQIFTLILG